MPQLRTRRRPLRELSVCSVALLVALTLGACTQPSPQPIPSGSPAVEPVFASDAEALAAAEEAYSLYQEMWNTVAMEGGLNADRMRPFVHPDSLVGTLDGLSRFANSGLRTSGKVTITRTELQSYRDAGENKAEVLLSACVNFVGSRILDKSGVDVTDLNRADVLTSQVTFISSPAAPQVLQFGGDELWDGKGFCD